MYLSGKWMRDSRDDVKYSFTAYLKPLQGLIYAVIIHLYLPP